MTPSSLPPPPAHRRTEGHPPPVEVVDSVAGIFLIPGILSPEVCAQLMAQAEAVGYAPAPITTAGGPVMAPHIRSNQRVMLDVPALAADLLERLRPHLPATLRGWSLVGLNERLRWYRYDPGERFDWHCDGAFVRTPRERSFLTVMLYLNEGFTGGETAFDLRSGYRVVQPQAGAALLFPHPLRHTGAQVRQGRKVVLRTDAMYALSGSAEGGR